MFKQGDKVIVNTGYTSLGGIVVGVLPNNNNVPYPVIVDVGTDINAYFTKEGKMSYLDETVSIELVNPKETINNPTVTEDEDGSLTLKGTIVKTKKQTTNEDIEQAIRNNINTYNERYPNKSLDLFVEAVLGELNG